MARQLKLARGDHIQSGPLQTDGVGAQKELAVALRRSALGEPVIPLPALFRCGNIDDRRLALRICKTKTRSPR